MTDVLKPRDAKEVAEAIDGQVNRERKVLVVERHPRQHGD